MKAGHILLDAPRFNDMESVRRGNGGLILRGCYYDYEQNYWSRYQTLCQEGVGETDSKALFQLAHKGR